MSLAKSGSQSRNMQRITGEEQKSHKRENKGRSRSEGTLQHIYLERMCNRNRMGLRKTKLSGEPATKSRRSSGNQ